ncbi:MAG: DUF2254 domain-containing protein [Rhodospirillales bacterium]|nr:DUF2254 domain-containing protein [Rhodospirillales bacterium]
MRAQVWKLVNGISQSYWFVPTAMAIAAAASAFGMVSLDRLIGSSWIDGIPWLHAYEADGARAVLQTIAGSMITVAGVTFSITIVAVASTAMNFGPRLMTNFMTDRGNQVTLGTFVATFLYCILVLTSVYGGEDSAGAYVFVPTLAVLGALLMGVASLGVLIYFIHHIPENIHISQMIAGIGHDLLKRIDILYPDHLGEGAGPPAGFSADDGGVPLPSEDAVAVDAGDVGYVQNIEGSQLIAAAKKKGLVLWMTVAPGAFVSHTSPLVLAKPSALVDAAAIRSVRAAFVLGARRTPSQDVLFLVKQLAEVAIRALSPGINDPFTACYCIDWFSAALKKLAGREIPYRYRFDDNGDLRVVAEPTTFENFADAMFGQLRPYAQGDRTVALHLLHALVDLRLNLPTGHQRSVIDRHCDTLLTGCHADLSHPDDKSAIDLIFRDNDLRVGRRAP